MKKQLVILSGAGISAESGIATFRDSNGLWENYHIEDVATPQAWNKNPSLVTAFYNERRKQIISAHPNQAHQFFASLQDVYDVTVITQNIDDLHERAGSKQVIHLHGNIRFAKSSGPRQEEKLYPIHGWELKHTDLCDDGFLLRPHVVWFGEEVPELEQAAAVIQNADTLIVIGTSLNVYPAAGLIHFSSNSCKKIVVDPKSNELKLDNSFLFIQKSAVEAIKVLKDIL